MSVTDSDGYFYVGPTSQFPNIPEGEPLPEGCNVFRVFKDTGSAQVVKVTPEKEVEGGAPETVGSIAVLVFRYKNKLHAVTDKCPHSAYSLSAGGTVADIEDFGIVFGHGITCSKHNWMFDLSTGKGDRGNYSLGLWDVKEKDDGVWVKQQ
ncbi:hypothetical protein YB2330_003139 [Saitoella coloradoensis]